MRHSKTTPRSSALASAQASAQAIAVSIMALAALAPLGCGGGGSGSTPDAAGVDASDAGRDASDDGACPTFAEVTLFAKCRACHSSTLTGGARMNATVGVDFDQYDSARTQAVLAQTYVSLNLMPPPERNTPATAAEKAGLDAWIACGTPR